MINPYALPPILAGVLNVALCLWVYVEAAPGPVRWTFILWNVSLAFWNASIALGYLMGDPQAIFAWYQMTVPLAISFISPFFLHFIVALTGSNTSRTRWMLKLGYANGVFFVLTGSTTHFLIRPGTKYFWGSYPQAGPGAFVFGIVLYVLAGYAFLLLLQGIKSATGYRRNQLNYVFAGAAIVFGAGFTNFLPLYGVSIYPIGNLMNSLYSLLVAYAMLEFGLMDIRVVLRRSAVYGLLSGALTLVYLSVVSIFHRLFGHYGLNESYVYYTAAVPITIVLAPPVKARLEPLVESAPFWKTYQYTEILKDFGPAVLTVLDLSTVAQRIVEKMSALVKVDSGAVYVRHAGDPSFFCAWSRGPKGPDEISDAHPLILDLQSHQSELSKEKALWEFRHEKDKDEKRPPPVWLERWPYALTLPLFVKQRFLGVIALGEKASGDMFNAEDIQLLKMLADQAAVALSNALRVAEIEALQLSLRATHDNALMGVLATEIAHEVAQPLTRIMNEQARLEGSVKGEKQESLKKIEKEARRATEIMDGFAMLSPQTLLRRTPTALASLFEEALNSLGLDQDERIRIVRHFSKMPLIPVNPGQLLQVLTNVLQNAWQAMPEGGVLTLSARLVEEASHEKFAELSVKDSGPGIPVLLQEEVFKPFYTTKQSSGGRGVGLTISRAMVERHGGTLSIQSPATIAGGTHVVVQLPLKLPEEMS